MKALKAIKFYLTPAIYKELIKHYAWAKSIVYKKRQPIHVTLSLSILYTSGSIPFPFNSYNRTTPNPNGLECLLSEDQVLLLVQSTSLIGLSELCYLAASLNKENKQNKL